MIRRKLQLATLLCLGIVLVLSGCGTSANKSNNQASVKTIKLGLPTAPASAQNVAAQHFGDLVKKYTNGSIVVNVFPNSQLGTAAAMMQDLTTNTVQMTITATADNVVPQMQVFELPYMFPNEDVAMKVANGPIAEQVNQLFIPKGMRVLANWDSGYRDVVSKRPVTNLQSMKGLRIRVINSPIWNDLFKALGADPIAMDYNQVYTGLQQGVIDAAENPISNLYGMKFYEPAKYLAITNHSFGLATVLISEKFWESLTPEQQKGIQRAATETITYETDLTVKQDQDFLKEMEASGVTVTHPTLAPFNAATKVVYTQLESAIGKKLIDQVEQAVKS